MEFYHGGYEYLLMAHTGMHIYHPPWTRLGPLLTLFPFSSKHTMTSFRTTICLFPCWEDGYLVIGLTDGSHVWDTLTGTKARDVHFDTLMDLFIPRAYTGHVVVAINYN